MRGVISTTINDLMAELSTLQSRRGLQDSTHADVVGPLLTRALRLDEYPVGEERRRVLVNGLLQHAEPLPPDLRFVFLSACALQSQDRPVLSERLERAGATIRVNVRTAWRRLNAANRRVAESLAAMADPVNAEPAPEWFLVRLISNVDLRESRPIYRSTHTIRVVSPYLNQITEGISFPGAEPEADPEFHVGGDCKLSRVVRQFTSNWLVTLDPGRAYACGEELTYTLSVRAPSRRLVHPMSVMLSERECRSLATEVNYGTPSVARQVWLLDGVPGPVAEVDEPCGVIVNPYETPVVRVAYERMTRGRVYGIRWQWADGVDGG